MLLAGLNGFALSDLELTVIAAVSADGFIYMDFFRRKYIQHAREKASC